VIRAFLDANVLFRAAHSRAGASWGVIELAGRRNDFRVITTEYVFNETESKLQEKSPASLGEYATIRPLLETCPDPPDALTQHLERLIRDKKDRPVLSGAIYAKADFLLTLDDRDFGPLYGIRVYDVLITSPAQGLHRFRQLV
jgi:predicted nucleic acid-binding protein